MSKKDQKTSPGGPSIFAFSESAASQSDLHQAIDCGEIELLFQAQVEAGSGKIIGAEALARWNRRQSDVVGGQELFALARRYGLARELSRHVCTNALKIAANWPQNMQLSLNIIPEDLASAGFCEDLAAQCLAAGFAANRLTAEIIEDVPIVDLRGAAAKLEDLRTVGIRVALDDFGAGYCNFAYLRRLPLDMIKLDRSLVCSIDKDKRDLAIMRSIISLAVALDLDVVAEGIETGAQRDIAKREGCKYLQGFLFGEADKSEKLLELVAALDG